MIETSNALRSAGLTEAARDVDALRKREQWSHETVRVIKMVMDAANRLYDTKRLRVLLYPSGLRAVDREELRRFPDGIVWLA